MTVKYKEYPEQRLVELVVDGKVTQEDFNLIAGQMESFIKMHGKIKLLEEIRKFEGFDPSVLWDGIIFDMKYLKNFSHCAVLTDMGWVGPFSKAAGAFISCKVRTFPLDKKDDAKAWLQTDNT